MDKSGNVGMIFAITLIPVMTMVGASVDYGRSLYVKANMQNALDAAVLASGREFQMTGDATAAETMARDMFKYRFEAGKGLVGSPHISTLDIDTANYKMTAEAKASVPAPFLKLVGIPEIGVGVRSQSSLTLGGLNTGQDLEIAMMMDITGSMNGTTASGNSKLHDAKLAAKDLINILIPDGYAGEQTARIGLVPFSQYVNVGTTFYKKVTGSNPTGENTCVVERSGTHKYTDEPPMANQWIGKFQTSSNQGNLSCEPEAEIIPLTTDKAKLTTAIDGFQGAGWTAGHLGTAWSWYMLSHKWAGVWPTGSKPDVPRESLVKVAVLMTDGDYNTYYRNSTSSQKQATNFCNGMKAAGIVVYTIAFGDDMSSPAKTALANCASSSEHFHNAVDGDELRSAFRSIALQLSQLRLTQ
jgi:Flp pilus assembly protein TadG